MLDWLKALRGRIRVDFGFFRAVAKKTEDASAEDGGDLGKPLARPFAQWLCRFAHDVRVRSICRLEMSWKYLSRTVLWVYIRALKRWRRAVLQKNAARIPPLPPLFDFELSAVALIDGERFEPLKDATDRWWHSREAHYVMGGYHVYVLYRLRNRKFIRVRYDFCHLVSDGGRTLWMDGRRLFAERISGQSAVRLVMRFQRDVPEFLEMYVKQLARRVDREPRPLAYWYEVEPPCRIHRLPAHEIDLLEHAESIVFLAIRMIHSLRSLAESQTPRSVETHFLEIPLYARFNVDPDRWWGDSDVVPPSNVDFLELSWPENARHIAASVRDLRAILDEPLAAVLAPRRWALSQHSPTASEQARNAQAMVDLLPDLEARVVRLTKAINDHKQRRAEPATADQEGQKKRSKDAPDEKKLSVFRTSLVSGMRQEDIAEIHGIDQGTVSRYLSQVRKWISAGNELPPPEKLPPPTIHPYDPKLLDMGAHQEGRTPRQRNRKDDD